MNEKKSLGGPIAMLVIGHVLCLIGTSLVSENVLFGLLSIAGLPIWIVGLVKLINTIKHNVRVNRSQQQGIQQED